MTPKNATMIAIAGLQYLAGDNEQLSRFVALTGMTPDMMRENVDSAEFLAAILDYFLGDEPTLLAFSAANELDPASIQKARHALVPNTLVEGWE